MPRSAFEIREKAQTAACDRLEIKSILMLSSIYSMFVYSALQAVAAVREEDLMLLGVLPGHARRMLLRLPSLRAAAIPVDGGAAAAAANNPA